MPRIAGLILLPADADPELLAAARILIRVEDAGRADAAAIRLGEARIDRPDPAELRSGRIAFAVDFREARPGADPTVRVLIDVDRDGSASVGDYVSTVATPVAPALDGQPLLVAVILIPPRD